MLMRVAKLHDQSVAGTSPAGASKRPPFAPFPESNALSSGFASPGRAQHISEGAAASALVTDGNILVNLSGPGHNSTPLSRAIPTTLRAGRGRPQRLAVLLPPAGSAVEAAGTLATAPAITSSAANAPQLAVVAPAARTGSFSRASTPLPRSLTSPLPPLAEVPAWTADLLRRVLLATVKGSAAAGRWTLAALRTAVTDPARARANAAELWTMIKEEAHHYWVGSKLLVAEVRTSTALLRRVGRGDMLTRRERLQLKRTVGDLLRMVPFVIIVIIPFAELSLPLLLKLFPNMLPSQFEVRCPAARAAVAPTRLPASLPRLPDSLPRPRTGRWFRSRSRRPAVCCCSLRAGFRPAGAAAQLGRLPGRCGRHAGAAVSVVVIRVNCC
jgi:hypothetical protein